jgi:aminobenzoyl-glutamate transport protein
MKQSSSAPPKKNIFYRSLDLIEIIGNKLPHPATLFALLAVLVALLSGLFELFDVTTKHPGTGEEIKAVSLLSGDGLRRIVTNLVRNFTGFAPLGTVLVALLGIGLAEASGLIGALLRGLVLWAPRKLITMVVVFAGIMSNAASEAGYVILIPLAAVIFQAFGRHPLVGLAAAFAGVSAGYSANLLLGTVDPLLAGLTTESAKIIQPTYLVNPAANYYFMMISTFLLTFVGTWVTEKIVAPRFPNDEVQNTSSSNVDPLSVVEKRGIRAAALSVVILTILLLLAVVPEQGVLRDPKTFSVLDSPFLHGIVAILFLFALVPGIVYGYVTKAFKNDADIINGMGKAMSAMGTYIVLVFFAAQFVSFFSWTNIGLIIAITGAEFLKGIGLVGIPLIVSFIFVSAFINLFMGSASAKWAVMAPVFVPMFMLLGYSPELTQCAYRIGDSCTNVVTPMMSYFALIVAFAQKHKPESGIGTIIATMLPYSLFFLITWSLLLIVWILIGIPVGPGAGLYWEGSLIP